MEGEALHPRKGKRGNSHEDVVDQVKEKEEEREDVEFSSYYLYSFIDAVEMRGRQRRPPRQGSNTMLYSYDEDHQWISQMDMNSNRGGPTPLHLAVLSEKLDMVSFLLDRRANPNMPNKKTGETVLHWITRQWDGCIATDSIRLQILDMLLLYGANPNKKNRLDRGTTPLCNAIRSCCNSSSSSSSSSLGRTSIVRLLLESGSANPKKGGSDGLPLDIAISKYIEIGMQKPISSKNLEGRRRLLKEVIPMLLNHGADPNIENPHGHLPINQAVSNGEHELLNLLLEYGSDPNSCGFGVVTCPLETSVLLGHVRCARILLDYGAVTTGELSLLGRKDILLHTLENSSQAELQRDKDGNVISMRLSRYSRKDIQPTETFKAMKHLHTFHIQSMPSMQLPKETWDIQNLTVLKICHSALFNTLPPEVGKLKNLETLHMISLYRLDSLPADLANLPNLYELHIKTCPISRVPTQALPTSLRKLDLSECKISNLEMDLKLPSGLQLLQLHGNKVLSSVNLEPILLSLLKRHEYLQFVDSTIDHHHCPTSTNCLLTTDVLYASTVNAIRLRSRRMKADTLPLPYWPLVFTNVVRKQCPFRFDEQKQLTAEANVIFSLLREGYVVMDNLYQP